MKKIGIILFVLIVCGLSVVAQERKPSEPVKPYVVKTNQEVSAIEKALHSIDPEIKTKETVSKTEDLIPNEGLQLRVAIQYDAKKNKAGAEVHDASDDVYYVLQGSAELTLGGKLENPKEATAGEWKSDTIIGGKTFTIKKGDLIVVPRGTPHQRINTKGKTFSLILIKIFKDPLPAKK
ncbi:MAG TPA: cupin domain-containing protein [Pyrinomonadaceae bacterium]|nr:cupin domain-containing protein [Pyrinomonadaceae bacterium]